MPPAVSADNSDAESVGSDIPAQAPKGTNSQAANQLKDELQEDVNGEPDKTDPDEDDDEEADGDEEGVYIVEKIMGHRFHKGELQLQVKWKGYDDPNDETLEPEENLMDGAKAILKEYYKSIGGKPSPEKQSKKRKSTVSAKSTPDVTPSTKKRKGRQSEVKDEDEAEDDGGLTNWLPKGESWENYVQNVDTIERDGKDGGLYVFLHWNNDKKTKVSIDQCYKKCPMRMLHFYENHLVFKES